MIKKIIFGLLAATVIIILGNIIWPVDRVAIEVAPETIFTVGSFPITNAFFTSILLSLALLVVAFVVGRNLKEQPTGLQNIIEYTIEALDGLITSIAPKKWAPTFFPVLVTIFIYLLFANWISLLTPLLGSFGIVHPVEHGGIPIENIIFISGSADSLQHGEEMSNAGEAHAAEEVPATEAEGAHALIVPLFRAPSSDLNLTLGLALTTMILVQFFGIREHGVGYFKNFIRVKGFKEQGIMMGTIDFVIGLIEGLSEMAKVISFSFRLFGNIFAGEVVLIVISALVTLFLVVIFFGFEIFVGFIQAFVFFILSLVFLSLATQHHEH